MKQGINMQRQAGMTQIAWILAIVFLITSAVLFIRLVPPYLEHFSVKKSLQSLAEDPNIKEMSPFKMRELLTRRFYVNNVKDVSANSLEIVREGQKISLQLNYEVRVHAVANVDVVLKFNEKADIQ